MRGLYLKRASEQCRCELCMSKIDDAAHIALRAAQIENKHDMLCGSVHRECAECEAAMKRYMTQPVGLVRMEVFRCSDGPELEPDDLTREYTNIYTTAIERGRVGSILDAPVWVYDVAVIGDEVLAQAQAEIAKEHAKRAGAGAMGNGPRAAR